MNPDGKRSEGACEVTMPSANEVAYDMTVTLPMLRADKAYTLHPWLRVVADDRTADVKIAAGIRAVRSGKQV